MSQAKSGALWTIDQTALIPIGPGVMMRIYCALQIILMSSNMVHLSEEEEEEEEEYEEDTLLVTYTWGCTETFVLCRNREGECANST